MKRCQIHAGGLGEPIWVTAEKQGKTAATFFYPGTEALIQGIRPSKWQVYDEDVSNTERVQGILQWLDLPAAQRPKFLTLYFSTVDDAGHAFGPDAPQTAAAVAEVDRQIAMLVEGLKQRQLYGKVDVMIVSDHGMAEVTPQRAILLDQLFDTNKRL